MKAIGAPRRLALAACCLPLAGPASAVDAEALRAPPGASSCSGCHVARADGSGELPRLAGRPAGEIVAAMAAFRSGERPATLMNRIAKGFDEEETRAIADWLSRQR